MARDTRKSNIASLRILTRIGMAVYAESEDAFWLKVEREDFKESD